MQEIVNDNKAKPSKATSETNRQTRAELTRILNSIWDNYNQRILTKISLVVYSIALTELQCWSKICWFTSNWRESCQVDAVDTGNVVLRASFPLGHWWKYIINQFCNQALPAASCIGDTARFRSKLPVPSRSANFSFTIYCIFPRFISQRYNRESTKQNNRKSNFGFWVPCRMWISFRMKQSSWFKFAFSYLILDRIIACLNGTIIIIACMNRIIACWNRIIACLNRIIAYTNFGGYHTSYWFNAINIFASVVVHFFQYN